MIAQFNQEKYNNILQNIRFNINQSDIFMTNDYFEIIKLLNLENKLKSVHIGFVYSYLYLQSYMLRNTTYDYFIPTPKDIKYILGYNQDEKRLDYIIKKNGLLDKEKLTITDNDFPIVNSYNKDEDYLEFTTASQIYDNLKEFKDIRKIANTTTYKFPVLSFYDSNKRSDIKLFYGDDGGTFYDVHNTTRIRFEVFAYCMSNQDIGATGFYLYSYIKHMNDLLGDEYKATASTISNKIGVPERTVKKYLKSLKSYNLIDTIHNMDYFSLGIEKEYRKASTHLIKSFEEFTVNTIDYYKLPMKTRAEHFNKIKEVNKEIENISELL